MLAAVGVSSIDELFADIPEEVRLRDGLDLPPALAEAELEAVLEDLASKNKPATRSISFLGAGAYDHYVPAVVDAITGRSEFYTAYTPYQPERSQGVLQAIFEYQTAICELTALEVSNASLYDGATALAEAAFMAHAETRRAKVVVSGTLHPEYRQVLVTETRGLGLEIVEVGRDGGGLTDTAALRAAVDEQTAAVALQQPNFFGGLEDMAAAAQIAHDAGALFVAVVDPLSLGVLAPPGEYGADVAVGEGQAHGQLPQLRRPLPGLHGRAREAAAAHAGAHRGRDRRRRRQARLRAHAADARAAHPPRAGDLEHLLQPGAQRAGGPRLPLLAGQSRAARAGRALRAQGRLPARPAFGAARRRGVHNGSRLA